MGVLIGIIAIALVFIGGRIKLHYDYNHGTCRKCGCKFEHIGSDSQGSDGYVCPKCGKEIWI